MITINREFNLDEFEAALRQVAAGDAVLKLPNRIKTEAVGGIAALAQLIISWSKANYPAGELQVHAKDEDDSALSNFACTVTGLTALNLSNKIVSVQGKKPIERASALRAAIPFVEAMNARSLKSLRDFSKTTIPLLCLDNSRNAKRPPRLYQSAERVRDRSGFADLLSACFEEIGPEFRREVGSSLMNAAASLVYEAFANTHEHAQTDFRGDRLTRSVRALVVGIRRVPIEQQADAIGNHVPLKKYFENWRPTFPSAKNAQFIDISLFDCGSGLAQTWLGRKGKLKNGIREDGVSLEDEFDAVLACLKKGGTTKPGDSSGNGLYRIMEVVQRAGGFIRIRSGRLSLLRAFGPDDAVLDPNNISMNDAVTGEVPARTRAWADGTALSVLLPLNRGEFQ